MAVKYYDWLAHHEDIRGDKIAIRDLDTDQQISYRQLNRRAASLAAYMQANGVKKGDRVALLIRNCPAFFEVQFACSKIGAICLPLNWRLTPNELTYILNDSTPCTLVHDHIFSDTAPELAASCNIGLVLEVREAGEDSSYEQAMETNEDFTPVETTHDDVSMIMYTSGTTGHPKGAMITPGMVCYNIVNLSMPAGVDSKSVQLVVLPLFHTGGLNCYANPILHAGGEILLLRDFDPGAALRVLDDADLGVTHFFAVPAPYQFMMQHPDFEKADLSRLVNAGVGGAPCAEAILQGWLGRGVPLVQGWGMTETSPGGISLEADDALRKIGSAGKALMHTEIRIIDDEGDDVAPNEVGELIIKGPNITPGYWNNPEATEKSFIDGWLKTGDAAKRDDEGFVYIVDRSKDMYISGGENVYPAEVENVIYQLPQIAEAAVIGVPSDRWGETGKAVLVLKQNETLDGDAVIAHCVTNLAKFKVPGSVEFIEALPRNATGKVLKRNLRDMYVDEGTAAIT
ncbi:MAG: long-chain fatty acid--CoA ligase [PS1 clade bacterium]|nr:long-chain fatty acid--CoA ligase [PS1 clade bacterium]